MQPVIIAVKPRFAELILSGVKTVEFRKTSCPAQKFYFYATAPFKKIIGVCRVADRRQGNPDDIWNVYGAYGGITRAEFNAYYAGRNTAFAFILRDVKRYSVPKDLSDFGVKRAPQTFRHVVHDYEHN